MNMALLGQILVAIVSIVCFLLRYYFKDLSKKSSRAERKKFEFAYVFMTGTTVAGLICTVFLVVDEMIKTGQDGAAFLKMFLVGIIICEIINYKNDDLKDGLCQFLAVLIPGIIALLCVGAGAMEYSSNVNEAAEQKYSQEQFELVEIFEDKKPEISVNTHTSISKFFKYEVEEVDVSQSSEASEEENNTSKIKQTYEICYIDKSEQNQQICKTINFEDTSLKPVPEGQKPYMIVKTYTSYSINNNVDPPEECDFEYAYKYDLYVPKEDIEDLSKLLKKK